MSATHKNVIEINGRLYDAKSGMLLSGTPVAPTQADVNHPQPSGKASQSIDGVRPQKVRHTKINASPVRPRTQQRSATLMRQAVKKPVSDGPAHTTVHKHIATTQRSKRASEVDRSPFVHKFNPVHQTAYTKKHQPLTVQTMPSEVKVDESKKIARQAQPAPIKPATQSEELFNDAMAKAPKSKKDTKNKKTRKGLRWVSGLTAAVLLVGFIAYMNIPNFNMKLASTRAGFAANLPTYSPAGFKTGSIDSQPGQVKVTYTSNTDRRNFELTQEVSSWNSQTLQSNFLEAENKVFEEQQDGGRTIFLYDNGSAAWVNGGVKYQINSSVLSTDQILKIASSL